MTSQRIADVYLVKKINKKEEEEEEEKLAKRFISHYPSKTFLEIEAKQLCGNGTAT